MNLRLYTKFAKIFRKFFNVLNKLLGGTKITECLHESDNFIIINKAYDLKINSNDVKDITVQTFMKQNYPSLASRKLCHEYYFVHRLDYSTSGVMCIPVHKKACQLASRAIKLRLSKKYYVAIVRGYVSLDLVDLCQAIGRDSKETNIEKMDVVPETARVKGRASRTIITVLEAGLFNNYPATKVLIRPITGRRHQIRVHCSHIGHTIVGDYTYSNRKDVEPPRMFLHSLRLVLPTDIENLDFQTDDPFTQDKVSGWSPVFKFLSLEEGFRKIDKFVG